MPALLLFASGVAAMTTGGCQEPLMPTPIVFADPRISATEFTDENHRTTTWPVFYATDRSGRGDMDDRRYSNGIATDPAMGVATVRFNPRTLTWDQLAEASNTGARDVRITLALDRAEELATLQPSSDPDRLLPPADHALTPEEQAFADRINAELEACGLKNLFIYVHGIRVDFEHACVFTAQLHHFLGREGVSVAYAWPSAQTLLLYARDVNRGRASANRFARFVDFLERHTIAEKIDIVSYSAGARVVSNALVRYAEERQPGPLRIDDVVFAAGDLTARRFVNEHLPVYHDEVRRIQVTTSDRDMPLRLAGFFHGSSRLGRPNPNEFSEDAIEAARALTNLHIIDTSYADDLRGKVITGHGYWFANPWTSSDVLVSLRFNLDPGERGLVRIEGRDVIAAWSITEDYPERVAEAVIRAAQAEDAARAEDAAEAAQDSE